MGYAFYIVMLALAGLLLFKSGAAAEGAAEGLRLFAEDVLPCLFPFMVCGQYLTGADGHLRRRQASKLGSAAEGLWQWLLCALCGTPSAAIICRRRFEQGSTRAQASMLCAALNQMNPFFVCVLVASRLFSAAWAGWVLAAAHYFPALIFTLALIVLERRQAADSEIAVNGCKAQDRGKVPLAPEGHASLALAISGAVSAVLKVGGTVVFFRVIIAVADSMGVFGGLSGVAASLISGLFEMTNGVALLGRAALADAFALEQALALCSGLLSFGGVCVFMQSKLFFEELSARHYFAAKLLTGGVSYAVCRLLYPCASGSAETSASFAQPFEGAVYSVRAGGVSAIMLCVFLAAAASFVYARIIIRRPVV